MNKDTENIAKDFTKTMNDLAKSFNITTAELISNLKELMDKDEE